MKGLKKFLPRGQRNSIYSCIYYTPVIKKCDLKYTIIKRKIYTLLQYYSITEMNLLKPRVPILNFMRFRGSRKPREVLEKPEDKSTVILGKWKPSVAYPKPGVSDKAVSFQWQWFETLLQILFFRTPSMSNGTDLSLYRQ